MGNLLRRAEARPRPPGGSGTDPRPTHAGRAGVPGWQRPRGLAPPTPRLAAPRSLYPGAGAARPRSGCSSEQHVRVGARQRGERSRLAAPAAGSEEGYSGRRGSRARPVASGTAAPRSSFAQKVCGGRGEPRSCLGPGRGGDMRGLLVAANLLLAAAAYSGFVNGEGTDVTENEVYHERNSRRVGTVQLFQTRAGSEYEEERDRGVTSSGDYFIELPRVAFLSKPQELVTPKKKGNGKKRRKGKGMGKKRDPCLQKYKDFCIHGECKYIKELGAPSCIVVHISLLIL